MAQFIDAKEDLVAEAIDGALPSRLGAVARAARIGADATALITRAGAGWACYVAATYLEGHKSRGA